MVSTLIFALATLILSEAVCILAYTIYKMKKELVETRTNLDNLAECVLKLARHTAGIDVVETSEDEFATDINFPKFPNSEGF